MDILNEVTTEAQASSIVEARTPRADVMFPHTFDSTMLAAFRSCPQKMFRTYVQHWKPKAESVHLVAGGAFAKGIEVARVAYFEGSAPEYEVKMIEGPFGLAPKTVVKGQVPCEPGDREFAEAAGLNALLVAYGDFECPPDSAKSLQRTAGALEFYFANYPLGGDGMSPILMPNGRRGIEFSFAEPLPINHPVTGDPILYTGRADMIAEFAGGVYIVDEKTASQLGASWPRQWEMRGQFTGYQWAARNVGIEAQGSIVRGVSILKTKYDTLQAITYRAPFEINRWLDQSCRDIERAIKAYSDGWWDYAMDGACAEYGGCSMMQICKSPEPESWLPMYFEQRVWDPLARRQLTVEEWEASWGHKAG
jgi:hypothetical protein